MRKEDLKRIYEHETPGYAKLDEEEATHFYQEDLVMWIDPLDGTKSFSTGETKYATCLIGK